jgi:hypothetical protein
VAVLIGANPATHHQTSQTIRITDPSFFLTTSSSVFADFTAKNAKDFFGSL